MSNVICPETVLLQGVFSAGITLVWFSLYTLVLAIRLAVFIYILEMPL